MKQVTSKSNRSAELRTITPVNNDVEQRSLQTQEERAKWWKFQITDEQARAWQNGDVNAAKQFYNENEDILKGLARKYKYGYVRVWGRQVALLKQAQEQYAFYDMINQIYVDLPNYRFYDGLSLIRCIRKSCIFVGVGGYLGALRSEFYCVSLDKPILGKDGDDNASIADFIASRFVIDEELQANSTAMSEAFERTLDKIAQTLFPKNEQLRQDFIMRV